MGWFVVNDPFVTILGDKVLKKCVEKKVKSKKKKGVEMNQLLGISRCKKAMKTSVL